MFLESCAKKKSRNSLHDLPQRSRKWEHVQRTSSSIDNGIGHSSKERSQENESVQRFAWEMDNLWDVSRFEVKLFLCQSSELPLLNKNTLGQNVNMWSPG